MSFVALNFNDHARNIQKNIITFIKFELDQSFVEPAFDLSKESKEMIYITIKITYFSKLLFTN